MHQTVSSALLAVLIIRYYVRTFVLTEKVLVMLKVKVTSIGNSMGILLPKEALSKMKVSKGDALYLVESPED